MHIAIDGRALTGRYTGDRTYWRNLLRVLPHLAPDVAFHLYSRVPIAPDELPAFPNLTYHVVPAANDRLWTLAALPRALRQERPDLVHVQYTVPPACPCPIVTTIHDISFRLYPQWFPARDRLLLNLTIPSAMRLAARVITDSDSSRDDILRMYRIAPEKVVSIPLGLPPEFASRMEAAEGEDGTETAKIRDDKRKHKQEMARQIAKTRYRLTCPFVLAVGVLQPRKNLRLLARAFGRAKSTHALPHQLVLVGKAGWHTEQETLRQEYVAGGGPDPVQSIIFPGYVDDADLPTLYQACDAFAYPSLYEGFGFPPLEAMACGAATLVSDAPPMPLNVGHAALVVPARDVDAWCGALVRVLTDAALRADLRAKGPAQAAQFTWQATAEATLRVYKDVVEANAKISRK